mgnify:FL=1
MNITIVGLGLLGGSFAKGLSEKGYTVKGIDIDKDTCAYAVEQGWCVAADNDPGLLEDADVVLYGLYPHLVAEHLKNNQDRLKSGCIVTDVTGVKQKLISDIREFKRADIEFMAAHPMAGTEHSGIRYANTEMFNHANFILVPSDLNTDRGYEFVKKMAEELGFAHISSLSAEEHDHMIGFVSHLPHVISVSLMNTCGDERLVDYVGGSFRDMTRIASINGRMWTELFLANKETLIGHIDAFRNELDHFAEVLEKEDVEEMNRLFEQSTERRKSFDKR